MFFLILASKSFILFLPLLFCAFFNFFKKICISLSDLFIYSPLKISVIFIYLYLGSFSFHSVTSEFSGSVVVKYLIFSEDIMTWLLLIVYLIWLLAIRGRDNYGSRCCYLKLSLLGRYSVPWCMCLLWIFREHDGCMFIIFLAYSSGMFRRNACLPIWLSWCIFSKCLLVLEVGMMGWIWQASWKRRSCGLVCNSPLYTMNTSS